jgi:DNA-binding MarR family transcriptional regulator
MILSRTISAKINRVATTQRTELPRGGSSGPLGHNPKRSEPEGRVFADLIFLLSQAAHALTTELTAGLAGLGISPRSHCVLSKALEGEQTQIRLAERCAMDKTTMVVTVDELERLGLAERRPSPTDRRARIITVTEAGERKVAEGDAVVENLYSSVLDSLPEDEREPFVDALTRLVNVRLANPPACERAVRRPRSG